MKLVELLARELSEWPEEAYVAVQDPDRDNTIWYQSEGHEHLRFEDDRWICRSMFDILVSKPSCRASDYKTAIVTESQWQAERDRQKGGEWKRHRGGKQPVADDVRVEVKLRCGDIQQYEARAFAWPHTSCDVDANIMQYRVISQPQAEEVEVPKLSRLEARMLFSKPCIVYPESTEAKTDQIDGPLKWRDTIIHCQAIIEDCEREILANVNLLDSEGLFMQLEPKKGMQAYDVPAVDMGDWKNWEAGDILKCNEGCGAQFTRGTKYTLTGVDGHTAEIEQDDEGDANGWGVHKFTWHSRP